jgi:hypothetical protein
MSSLNVKVPFLPQPKVILSNLRLAILIQSSDSLYVKNTDKSSVSAVFSGSGIQIECV